MMMMTMKGGVRGVSIVFLFLLHPCLSGFLSTSIK
jgi:hypothetical protein